MVKGLWLLQNTHGLELFEEAANIARSNVDELVVGNAEILISAYSHEQYDLILCLDVLEHFVDPWGFVEEMQNLLKPGGVLIASIPNIRNAMILFKLLFLGRFDYQNSGILDKTHLRFFTKKSAKELMSLKKLKIMDVIYNPISLKSKTGILNIITCNAFRNILTTQFLIKSEKYQ